jgi:hypothetical protein
MSPKEPTALRIDTTIMAAMRDLKDQKGIPITTQLEMAIREWLKKEHGIVVKRPERRRPDSRKRS